MNKEMRQTETGIRVILDETLKRGRIETLLGIGRFLQNAIADAVTTVEVSHGRASGLVGLEDKLKLVIEHCNQHKN